MVDERSGSRHEADGRLLAEGNMVRHFLQTLAFEAGWHTWRFKRLLGLHGLNVSRILFSIEDPNCVSILAKQIGHQRPAGEPVSISQQGTARIAIGKGVVLRRGVSISAEGSGLIEIGTETKIGKRSTLEGCGAANIIIGSKCRISWDVMILSSSQHMLLGPEGDKGFEDDIEIGDHVWIGTRAMLLPGTKIGKNSVVAAGAVCTGTYPPGSLIAGVPGKAIRNDVNWRDLTPDERFGRL